MAHFLKYKHIAFIRLMGKGMSLKGQLKIAPDEVRGELRKIILDENERKRKKIWATQDA